jgi:hypothetical protein
VEYKEDIIKPQVVEKEQILDAEHIIGRITTI